MNLYGPRDNVDLEMSHVIPAMIRKFIEASARGDKEVVLWGDGSPTREFLYVDDAYRRCCSLRSATTAASPVNVGAGFEITIRTLAELVSKLTGYRGTLARCVGTSRAPTASLAASWTTLAKERFGFESTTPLEDGLAKTIAWYT